MNTISPSNQSRTICIKPIPTIFGLPAVDASADILTNAAITRPAELVSDLLHQGTKGVLASGSKAGKTWILLDLALSISTGTKFLRWDTVPGKVLFINFEIQPAFIKDRLTAVINRHGLKISGDLHFWNLRGKTGDSEALVANIIKQVDGKGYSLIILDPIYKLMVGKSENMSGGVGKLCNQIERVAEKSGAAVVYSHHFPKGNPKKKAAIDRMSGSGVFARDADTIMLLTEHTEPNCYTVETILRNLPQQQAFVVEWQYPVMVVREDLDPEDTVEDDGEVDTDEGLMDLLKPGPLSASEFQVKALALGLSRRTYYRVKAKLKEEGFIQFNDEIKTWELVKKVEAVPNGQNGTVTLEGGAGGGGDIEVAGQ